MTRHRIEGGLICVGGSLIRLISPPGCDWILPKRGAIPHSGKLLDPPPCRTCGALESKPEKPERLIFEGLDRLLKELRIKAAQIRWECSDDVQDSWLTLP